MLKKKGNKAKLRRPKRYYNAKNSTRKGDVAKTTKTNQSTKKIELSKDSTKRTDAVCCMI